MIYNRKLIKCGDIYHYYDYGEKYFKYGFSRDKRTLPGFSSGYYLERKKQSGFKRDTHIYRAKRSVKHIIQCNAFREGFRPIFVTLTFAENVKDLKVANRLFSKFVMRLNYKLDCKLRYLAIPEFQKRGAVHYHVLFFNMMFVESIFDVISSVWGLGFTFNSSIGDVGHLSNYVSKYLSKDLYDVRLIGEKSYFCSRGLIRPEVFRSYYGVLVDNSFLTRYSGRYIVRDYTVNYEFLEKWL